MKKVPGSCNIAGRHHNQELMMRKPGQKAVEHMLKKIPLTDLNNEVDVRRFTSVMVPEAKEITEKVRRIIYDDPGKLTPKVMNAIYQHGRYHKGEWCMLPVSIAMWLELLTRTRDERCLIALCLINAIRNMRMVPAIGDRAISLDTLEAFPPAVLKSVENNSLMFNVESISGIECLLSLLCFTMEGRQTYPEDVLDGIFVEVFPKFVNMLMVPVRTELKATMRGGKSTSPLPEASPYRFLCRPEEFFGTMLLCATRVECGVQGLLEIADAVRKNRNHGRLGVSSYPAALEKLVSILMCTTTLSFENTLSRTRLYSRYALW